MSFEDLATKQDLNTFKEELLSSVQDMATRQPEWVRPKVAAKILDVDMSTLIKFKNQKVIKHSKIGKVVYYNMKSIFDYLKENCVDRFRI